MINAVVPARAPKPAYRDMRTIPAECQPTTLAEELVSLVAPESVAADQYRTLRHCIEMRASRHAEVEIRKLAVQVLQLMQKEAPHLFNDYELTPLPDGTLEATTKHRKV